MKPSPESQVGANGMQIYWNEDCVYVLDVSGTAAADFICKFEIGFSVVLSVLTDWRANTLG
jgi:hypothetical protein